MANHLVLRTDQPLLGYSQCTRLRYESVLHFEYTDRSTPPSRIDRYVSAVCLPHGLCTICENASTARVPNLQIASAENANGLALRPMKRDCSEYDQTSAENPGLSSRSDSLLENTLRIPDQAIFRSVFAARFVAVSPRLGVVLFASVR